MYKYVELGHYTISQCEGSSTDNGIALVVGLDQCRHPRTDEMDAIVKESNRRKYDNVEDTSY